MTAIPTTPGMARAARSSTDRSVPPMVGGRAITVGVPGTGRSSAYRAAGDDVARVEARRRLPDARELTLGLRRRGHRRYRHPRRIGGQRSVRRTPAVGRDHRRVPRHEGRRVDPEALRGRGDEASARGGRNRAHRRVQRVHGVRPAGELVPDQLGARVVEHDVDRGQPRASSSSAATIPIAVVIPWPTSARGTCTTTRSSAVISITSR